MSEDDMEKEVKEAWLINATQLGGYDGHFMWYVLHGAFLDEIKQRVRVMRARAVDTAHDIADGARYFGLTSSVYPDINRFITPADPDDIDVLFPEEDAFHSDPILVGDKLENVLGLAQKDIWRFSGSATTLYVSGLTPYARLNVTARCGAVFRIELPPQWFDEIKQKQSVT